MSSQTPERQFELTQVNHPAPDAEFPCPLLTFLAEKYGFRSLKADGWDIINATLTGVSLVFEVEESPKATALVGTLRIVNGELGGSNLTAEELAYALRNWENPHAAADEIKRLRRIASG